MDSVDREREKVQNSQNSVKMTLLGRTLFNISNGPNGFSNGVTD
jgi:hypothetical protein